MNKYRFLQLLKELSGFQNPFIYERHKLENAMRAYASYKTQLIATPSLIYIRIPCLMLAPHRRAVIESMMRLEVPLKDVLHITLDILLPWRALNIFWSCNCWSGRPSLQLSGGKCCPAQGRSWIATVITPPKSFCQPVNYWQLQQAVQRSRGWLGLPDMADAIATQKD